MLSQVAAILVGLVAVLWLMDDSETALASLKNKRVLVTGASTGIGEQMAYQLATHGCHVTLTARRKLALQAVRVTSLENKLYM
ncbi:corticosteroid 11-beta-dehydrogenase isozyme 1 [Elysia marginata]|uniref:Corticosteroid 11-beta-dehydrogenase isozyme 1 n=1 Tax=Elysia marginata TaxID=1093978 RepID=A0AAV4HN49_9GAST|nr:corticosteroid 11-beta-dehydrogenase isozyme 1 [Elysia marginata]